MDRCLIKPSSESDGDSPPAAPEGRRQVAARGAFWSIAGLGASQAIRFAGNIVLAYLLVDPKYFGVMALVNVFLVGLQMLSDLGVWRSVTQNEHGEEPYYLNTAWTVQVIRGAALWLITCIIAWPYSAFYEEPMLLPYLMVAGAIPLVQGLESTSLMLLHRRVNLRPMMILNLCSQVTAISVMILWAYLSPSVWALVAGGVAASLVRLAGSHLFIGGHRPRFQWDPRAAKELMRLGKWIFFSSVLAFIVNESDRLALGKLVSKEELGVFSVALGYTSLATLIAIHLLDDVLFPIISRCQDNATRLVEIFCDARGMLLRACAGLCAAIAVGAPLFFELVYPENFAVTGHYAQWIVVSTWAAILALGLELVPLALGNSRVLFFGNIFRSTGILFAVPGFMIAGIPGLVTGFAAAYFIGMIFLVTRLPSGRATVLWQGLRYTFGLALYVAGVLAASAWLEDRLSSVAMAAFTVTFTLLPLALSATLGYRLVFQRNRAV